MGLTKIKAGALDAGAVDTTTAVADNAIGADDIASGAIQGAPHNHLGANSVVSGTVADNVIGLAQMAGGTDGQIITYDANGDPVAVGPGTDGQVLTSTGAGSPPAFEDVPASGAALTGSTDNTVVTVTGANAMQGETKLTFDGNTLDIDNGGSPGALRIGGNVNSSGRTNDTYKLARVVTPHYHNAEEPMAIFQTASDGTDNNISYGGSWGDANAATQHRFYTAANDATTTGTEQWKINSSGNLVAVQSGNGIDFAANTDNGGTSTATLLEDYEEGTFSATMVSSNLTPDNSSATGYYVKVGNIVNVSGVLSLNTNDGSPSVSGSDNITQSLPYAPRSNTAITGNIFQQNINAGPGTSVGHPHYYNPFPVDYVCYPSSDGIRFYINKIEYAYERMTNSHMSAGNPGYTWMAWSITYQTN